MKPCVGSEIDKSVKKLKALKPKVVPKADRIKKPSIKALKKRLWVLFTLYIRTRDCLKTKGTLTRGKCITCGKEYEIGQLHAGHFIAGRSNAVLFDEKGVFGQCYACNIGLHGNILEYRRKIIEMYGPGSDERMEAESKLTRKYTTWELEEMIQMYKEKILNLEEGDD